MKVECTKKLINKLQNMVNEIDDDVDFILKRNAQEGVDLAIKNAQKAFVKGYWTGNLARMVKVKKIAPKHYEIVSNAHYSGYLEYGTRYMYKEPFMFPTYLEIKQQVNEDLNRLLND